MAKWIHVKKRSEKTMLNILKYILLFVEVISAFMLIGVILLQKTKGQGIGMAFGAGVGESLFGAQVGNVLTKTTVILAIIFLLNTTILSLLGTIRREKSVADSLPVTAPQFPLPVPAEMPVSVPGADIDSALPGSITVGEQPKVDPSSDGEPALPPAPEGADTDKTSAEW